MTAAVHATDAPELPTGARQKLITVSLVLCAVLQVFDTSIVSIALQQMQGTLSATQDQMAWVLTSYLIAVAIMTPLWGALGGRFGRKRLLLVSTAGFTLFSFFSGTADTLNEILVYRFVQGLFGAALIPITMSAMFSVYRREDFGIAMSWWSVGIMFGPVFGPTVGGYIVEYSSWRWAFYLNVPLGILAFTMLALLLPGNEKRVYRKFNYFGFVTLVTAVALLQFILDRGQRLEWFSSPTIVIFALITGAALWMFVVNSLTSSTPFIDPVIFRDKNYVSGIVLRILFGAMLFGTLVLVPPFLQNVGGYPVLESGIIMAPRGVGSMVAAIVVGWSMKRMDSRLIIGFGMIASAVTMWMMAGFTQDIERSRIVAINLVQGFAFSCFVIPVNTVAFSTLPGAQRDVGTSFYSLLNNIGRSLGIAYFATLFASTTQTARSTIVEQVTPFNDAIRHGLVPELWDHTSLRGLAALNREVVRQAELVAYVIDFELLAAIIILCLPVLLLMGKPVQGSGAPN